MYHNRIKLKPFTPTFYYITNRAVGSQWLLGEQEKERFVELLLENQSRFSYSVLDYCVMSNHYHAVIMIPAAPAMTRDELRERWRKMRNRRKPETPTDQELEAFRWRIHDISAIVANFQQRFTQEYNEKHERTGHFFGGRFHSTILERGKAIANAMAYTTLNPIRAKIVSDPADYPWCAYWHRVRTGRLQRSDNELVQLIGGALGFPSSASALNSADAMRLLWDRFAERMIGTISYENRRSIDIQSLIELLIRGDLPADMPEPERMRLTTPVPVTTAALGSHGFVREVLESCRAAFPASRHPRKPTRAKVWTDLFCLIRPRRWLKEPTSAS